MHYTSGSNAPSWLRQELTLDQAKCLISALQFQVAILGPKQTTVVTDASSSVPFQAYVREGRRTIAWDHSFNLLGDNGEGAVVQFLFGLRPLKQPAVDQDISVIGFKPETGACDRTGAA